MINKTYKVTKVKAMQNEIYVKEGFEMTDELKTLTVGYSMVVGGWSGLVTSPVKNITVDSAGTIVVETENSIYTLVEEKNEKN